MAAYTDQQTTDKVTDLLLEGTPVLSVEDGHDAGYMVPRGEQLLVTFDDEEQTEVLLTVRKVGW